MSSLKWGVVKEDINNTNNKLDYVDELFSKYDSGSKYARALHALGKELLKYAVEGLSKGQIAISDMAGIVLLVIRRIGNDEGVRSYVNRIAPHIINAISTVAGKDTLNHLYEVAEALYPIIVKFGTQSSNSSITVSLLKAVTKLKQEPEYTRLKVKLFMLALSFVPLCVDSKPFSNIAAKTAMVVREMEGNERAEHNSSLWSIVDWCLTQNLAGLVRLPELIFQLTQNNIEDDTLDLSRTQDILKDYSDRMAHQNLRSLFNLVMSLISVVVSRETELADIQIPPNVNELFSTTQTDTIWILLAVCQFVSHILLKQTTIPTSWLAFICQVCKLMSRSPQKSVQQMSLELMEHVRTNIADLENFVSKDDGYNTYTFLLKLTLAQHIKMCTPSEGNMSSKQQEQVQAYLDHLEEVSGMLSGTAKQIQILELGTLIPGHRPPDRYLLKLAALMRAQGHLSDAITLLTLPATSSDIKLYLAICHISKLNVEPAAIILTGLEFDEEGSASCASILLTYCKFITTLKSKESFTLPNPITFCQDAKKILSSVRPDDCIISILMFISGLYGLDTITSQCAALLSPDPHNLISVLSAVPALLANKIHVSWDSEVAVLTDGAAEKVQIQAVLDKHKTEVTDNQSDSDKRQASTEDGLYCGVCSYVLLDKMLNEGCDVYDVSGQCMMFSLNAAHTKLKSWNRTNMSTRALLWQNCSVIPYTLHVLSRYISLLYTWGSVHLTFSFLDRLEQLAKFTRSEYWLARHRNLAGMVRVTLQYTVKAVPSVPVRLNTTTDQTNEFVKEYLETERYVIAETEIIASAVERSNRAIAARDVVTGTKSNASDEEEGRYPIFQSTLSPLQLTKLTLLQLSLSWSKCPPTQDVMVEYYSVLKRARDTMSRDMVPSEVRQSSEAWIALLASCLKPSVVHEVSTVKLSKKPVARRGRNRKQSAKQTVTKQTASKQTSTKQTASEPTSAKQTANKQTSIDHIQIGLEACAGLEPVLVKRELLMRKISGAPNWADVDEYHNLPFKHQLHDMMRDVTPESSDVTFPQSWTIANITKIDNVLYLGQRRSDSQVLYKRELPFTLKSQGVCVQNTSCLDEMRRIIESNDDSVLLITDKVEFWKSRYELNSSLEKLLERLETDWLGPWKGLLFGKPKEMEYSKNVKMSAAQLRKEIRSKYKVTVDVFLSEYLLDCYSILSEENISELLPDQVPLTDILPVLHDLAPPAPPTRHHVLLTLDQETDILPWEACGLFRNQPIARVPSGSFALTLLALRSLPVKLKKEETYYILNPGQDLPSTQAYFETWLADQEGWRGVAAKAPSVPEYRTALTSDLFVYLGHGSGKEFLGGKSIQDFKSRAVALLMGCNSGKIKHTPVGGTGTPIEYLLSGCPAVVGYMWNITDRDCDRYSKKLLELWLSEGDETSLLSLMNPSRDACKLPYLVGAAPVLYGVPDILTGS